jgi:hypothetical protein
MDKEQKTAHGLDTPAGYNGGNKPTSKELSAPTKVYAGSSKLGHDRPKGMIEGPCDDCKGGYTK